MKINKIDIMILKNQLDMIPHCGDYGEFYLKKDLTSIFLCLGDADFPELDTLEILCGSLEIEMLIEPEYRPNKSDYLLISRGIIEDNWDEVTPNLLSLDEYSEFRNFMEKLEA